MVGWTWGKDTDMKACKEGAVWWLVDVGGSLVLGGWSFVAMATLNNGVSASGQSKTQPPWGPRGTNHGDNSAGLSAVILRL